MPKNKLKISFDFDGTLEYKMIHTVARKLIKQGHVVCILTTRYSDTSRYEFDATGVNEEIFSVAKSLGIKDIYFTEMEWKYKSIDDYKIDIHIDDNRDEIITINEKCEARAILYIHGWKVELKNLIKILNDS